MTAAYNRNETGKHAFINTKEIYSRSLFGSVTTITAENSLVASVQVCTADMLRRLVLANSFGRDLDYFSQAKKFRAESSQSAKKPKVFTGPKVIPR